MATFFEDQRSMGFDPLIPWLMVGVNDVQFVIRADGDNDALSLQYVKSQYAVIHSDELLPVIPRRRRVISLRGLKAGHDYLLAKNSTSGQVDKLEIDVLPTRQLTIRFYRLSDRPGHRAIRNCAAAAIMLKRAHQIHFNQDRVELRPAGCESVHLQFDVGAKPKTSFLFPLLDSLFRPGSAVFQGQLHRGLADFHVFLIWDFEDDLNLEPGLEDSSSPSNRVLGVTLASKQLCIIKDFCEDIAGELLAHEVGHYLTPALQGTQVHHTDPKNLMYPVVSGWKLDRDQCRSMHANAALQKIQHLFGH